jgi:hypothetical protein
MNMELLRAAVVEALTGATDAETEVHDSVILPVQDGRLPAINVFTPSDLPEGTSLLTNLQIGVIVPADDGMSIGTPLDRLQRQVKAALKALWDEVGIVASYGGRDTQVTPEAAIPHAIMTLNYTIETLDDDE